MLDLCKAEITAASRLETRVNHTSSTTTVPPAMDVRWDQREVIRLRQCGPRDPRDLLFIGLTCEFETVNTRVEIHHQHPI
jgi:hypothetical protein